MRRMVAGASGRARSKMLGHGIDQSMHSAAVRYGRRPGPLVGVGQMIGPVPRFFATMNRRLRVVGVS